MKEEVSKSTPKIKRRKALKILAGATAAAALMPSSIVVGKDKSETFKIAIKNGKVFTEGVFKSVNVGITTNNLIQLSHDDIPAQKVIDATGLLVSPGFVDILADNAANPKTTYPIFEKYKLGDGCATVLQMHGGDEYPKSYYEYFQQVPHMVNYGIGVFVMRLKNMFPPATCYQLVDRGLSEGALGVCHSIEYQPTPYEELVQYARLAKKYERPFFLHLRYSDKENELAGVTEAINLAKDTGARIHIDHLHSTGGTFNMEKALEMIYNANNMGLEITTCVYPYSFWATYLISKRFDPGWQQRFGLTYEDLTIVGRGIKITRDNFDYYRNQYGVLVAVPEGTVPFKKTINLALQTDFCMIGSDGGIESEPRANNHPRGAGCFATAIRHGLSIGMSMEKILTKITSLPARLMRPSINNRAVIKNGNIADITLFDPLTIKGKASVANPNQFSEGISHVIINGEMALENGEIIKKNAGKALKY
ncbi:MAG: nitrate reductase [Cytophagales bacterium]|nr:MAG: nitrate reductase [Cytophagales bacterium]